MSFKPRLSFWQIINMNVGFFGIQYSFGLQQSAVNPIYDFLGAKPDEIPWLNLAGPLTGLLVQNGKPWLPVNENYKTINVAVQDKDANSILNYFRKVPKLRKQNEALIYGKFTLVDSDSPDVFAYTRELNRKKFLVLLNFKNNISAVKTGVGLSKAKVVINNYSSAFTDGTLKRWEAVIFEL
jgi:glycosidase